MKGLQTKKITVVAISIIALCLVSAYGFLFYTIKNLNNKASLLRQDFSLAEDKERKTISEKILLRGLEDGRRELEGYFINSENPVALIKRVEALGGISGVSLSISSLEPDKERKNVVIADMSLSGGFSQIFHFLVLLESIPFGVTVKRAAFGLAPSPKGVQSGWEGIINAEISHFIY
ncbi:MAG: hypothetical protein AAB355_02030 [Patescibacteria group bacterium]